MNGMRTYRVCLISKASISDGYGERGPVAIDGKLMGEQNRALE